MKTMFLALYSQSDGKETATALHWSHIDHDGQYFTFKYYFVIIYLSNASIT